MKLLFNSSMPRSGSELLQVLLHQNPRIYGSATSPLLEYQYAARANYDSAEVRSQDPGLMQRAFIGMCAGMAGAYYAALTERPVAIDKNRGWAHYYEWVAQWCPNPRMICMVRDLRSIVASMERIYRSNRHRDAGPDKPSQLTCMTVAQRAQHWLGSQPVGLALARTLDCFQRGVAKEMLFVRYEDLCTAPRETLARVYSYIGEEPFAHDFERIVKEVREDDSHYGIYGQHSIRPSLRAAMPGDWRDVLPDKVAAGIRAGNPWYFETFGY